MKLMGTERELKSYKAEMKKVKDQYNKNYISFVQYEKIRSNLKKKYHIMVKLWNPKSILIANVVS